MKAQGLTASVSPWQESFNSFNRRSQPTIVWSTYPQTHSSLCAISAWSVLNQHGWSILSQRQQSREPMDYVRVL